MNCGKVVMGPKDDTPVESLNVGATKIFRIEEIPHDELHLADDEMLVSCAHFHKEVFSTFGIPFLVKIKQGEPFSKVKGMFAIVCFVCFNCVYSTGDGSLVAYIRA